MFQRKKWPLISARRRRFVLVLLSSFNKNVKDSERNLYILIANEKMIYLNKGKPGENRGCKADGSTVTKMTGSPGRRRTTLLLDKEPGNSSGSLFLEIRTFQSV